MQWLLLRGSRSTVLLRAAVLIAIIAFADWRIEGNIPLGFLYLFPMLLVGSALNRWQIAAIAGLCTALTEAFDSFDWIPSSAIPRDILIFAAFFGMGLFVYEVARNRQAGQRHTEAVEREVEARRAAEEQLKVLVESSPAAIVTTDSEGRVLLANDAAHRLFGVPHGALTDKPIGQFLPALNNVAGAGQTNQSFRTVMQCRGHRADGDVFLADVWFSTYNTSVGPRLAAMVVDTSEEMRSREEFSLHQLLAASRILVGAVSHEIRNICGAIAVVHENLARSGVLAHNKDFDALGTLIQALERIAGMDLRQTGNQGSGLNLQGFLEELRIIVDPFLRESGIETHWSIEPDLPVVWADRQSLMQVFLNLMKNSERAMERHQRREISVVAMHSGNHVAIEVRDTGPGVSHPELLFRPFQPQAQASGLGLYLSRALMRSFRGDLRYAPTSEGASFIVELSPLTPVYDEVDGAGDSDSSHRRSQPVPREPQAAAPSRA